MSELPENIIWRWAPTVREYDEDDPHRWDDVAEEFAIQKRDEANCGLIVWAKYNGVWEANPWSDRAVIAKLLIELNYNVTLPGRVHHQWQK
jgi:hypothetical protein